MLLFVPLGNGLVQFPPIGEGYRNVHDFLNKSVLEFFGRIGRWNAAREIDFFQMFQV